MSTARPRCRQRERGAIYAVVLATSLLVTVIGLAGLAGARMQFRTAELNANAVEADALSSSLVDVVLKTLQQDAGWRTTYTHGTWTNAAAAGNGTYRFRLEDPTDDDLNDTGGEDEPIRLTIQASVGGATRLHRIDATSLDYTAYGTDITTNGDLEAGSTTGWSKITPLLGDATRTAVNDPADAAEGSFFMRVTDRTNALYGARHELTPSDLPEGATFRLRFYVRPSVAGARIKAHFWTWSFLSGERVEVERDLGPAGEWTLIEQEVPVHWKGASRTSAYINFKMDDTSDFDLDGVSFQPVSVATTWVLDPTSFRTETLP